MGSIRAELVTKAKESALCAIKVFNNPLIKFKSKSFVVLMMIAWTYLLHAYYRSKGIIIITEIIYGEAMGEALHRSGFYEHALDIEVLEL